MIAALLMFLVGLGVFTFMMLPMKRSGYLLGALSYILVSFAMVTYASRLMGTPRPVQIDFFTNFDGDAVVVNSIGIQDVAIYVWVIPDGATVPVSLQFPWNDKTAEQLQDASREGEAKGTSVKMSIKAQGGLDDREPKFWATPQQPMPDKNGAQ